MAEEKTVRENFLVIGMSCAACAANVERTLKKQPGVVNATVNYASAVASVEYAADRSSPEEERMRDRWRRRDRGRAMRRFGSPLG